MAEERLPGLHPVRLRPVGGIGTPGPTISAVGTMEEFTLTYLLALAFTDIDVFTCYSDVTCFVKCLVKVLLSHAKQTLGS